MQHKTSQILFSYWDDLRAGRRAPGRIEIDPARIAPILPETMMLEVTAPGSYRFRIAGTRICESLGMELRGINFLALWSPQDQRTLDRTLYAITLHGHATWFQVASTTSHGDAVTSELILLPLSNADGEITRFMGAWSISSDSEWIGASYLANHRMLSGEGSRAENATTVSSPGQGSRSSAPLVVDTSLGRIVTSQRRRFRVYDGGLS